MSATDKIPGTSIRLTLVAFCFSMAALLAVPSPLAAQWGWAESLNPWKQETAPGQTPTDPFAQRRGSPGPEYRMAARAAQQATPAAPSYGVSGAAASPGHSAPGNHSPSGSPSFGYSAGGYTTTGAQTTASGYPSTGQSTYAFPRTDGSMGGSPSNERGYQHASGTSQPHFPSMPSGAEGGASRSSRVNYVSTTPGQNFVAPPAGMNQAAGDGNANVTDNANDLFKPAKIVAIVNGQPILAGDVLGPVNQMLEERLAAMPEEQRASVPPEELEKFREQALKQMLPGLIDIKVVYLDFMRAVPADRREEMEKVLEKNYDEYQLESDLKAAGVNTRAELDLKLRASGGSLDKKKRMFVEKLVAQQQIQQKVKTDEEVTHQQMLDYYNEHAEDYQKPAKAQWEQLMVRFDRFPNRQAAWEAIANMGNQVLRGAPLASVAERASQGMRASKGGQYDWTSKGSLKNEKIDEVIFTLPVGELSPIIESPEGFHIVRVTNREDAGMVPFTEAQVEIKEQLKTNRRQAQMEAYLKEVKSKAQVWTVFDAEN